MAAPSVRVNVALFVFDGCPHVRGARELLTSCLAELALDVPIAEHRGDFASPTICVDGEDVMGASPLDGRACRLDLPTKEKLMSALRRAAARRG